MKRSTNIVYLRIYGIKTVTLSFLFLRPRWKIVYVNKMIDINAIVYKIAMTSFTYHYIGIIGVMTCAVLEGIRTPPRNLQSSISPILLEMKNKLFFIFVHFHSYTSNRINPQNNQITSIQVCVMGFVLLKVRPPWTNFFRSAPA